MKLELNKKLVNVIIPAYKAEKFIERCLDSVYVQTWFVDNKFTVTVCVDGCEKTLNKLNEIKFKYKHLNILYCKKNKGTYVALNTAFSTIKTGTCIVFGADDKMFPDMIELVLQNGFGGYVRHHGVLVTTKEAHNFFGGFYSWRCAGDSEILNRMKKVYQLEVYPMLFELGVQAGRITKSEKYGMDSPLRRKYREIIRTERPLFHEPETNDFEKVNTKTISFNIATLPARKKYLKRVIESIYDKVDIIRVCLNNYDKIPDFLNREKIVAVIPEKDWRDAGKFLWAGTNRAELYFSGDDDLLYSEDYFKKHIEFLEMNPDCAVTTHGRNLKEGAKDIRDFTFYTACLKDQLEDAQVQIGGTGVMAFDLSRNKIDITDIDCAGACDFGIAFKMAEIDVPIIARAHSKDELEYILPKDEPDLWSEKPFAIQKIFINKMEDLKKEIKLKSYVINLPEEVSRIRMFRAEEEKTLLKSEKIKPVTFKDSRLIDEIEAMVASGKEFDGLKKAKEISNRLTFSDILKNETAEKCLILEDDIYFKDGAKTIIKKILKELPKDFGICFLGCYLRGGIELKPYSQHLVKIKGAEPRIWGAHAIIFNRTIYKKVSEMLASSRSRITDIQIVKEIIPKFDCFIANPMICFQSSEALKMSVGGTMHSTNLNLDELEAFSIKLFEEKLQGER